MWLVNGTSRQVILNCRKVNCMCVRRENCSSAAVVYLDSNNSGGEGKKAVFDNPFSMAFLDGIAP
jgi:hypothetical protein